MLISIALTNAKIVMLIRHGEKLNDKVTNLSPKGQTRAYCLIDLFKNVYATPQKIYAQSPTEKKQSTRPKDTVTPLAESLGLEVDLSYTSGKVKKLSNDILSSPEEVVLVSWSNDNIPDIAQKLGVENPPEWDKDSFDNIWVIYDSTSASYVKNGNSQPIATYSGNGVTMDIVSQNVETCISQNIAQFQNGGSMTSGSEKINYNFIIAIFSLLVCVFINLC
jgi:broad specificity phosphatase PhoE